ncbi:hypothetical protein [Curtobacterium sp. PsM8]|uniref:hypothetical protein n=1 Tax=Curtobacterium sp. PsM8 TaxID=3030532 RepID=UPI00263BE751|nr:hypothetical protein [Curtobacterium sp. PsM8]MDN4649260.1 hypothetical protein [Curtobacterium sp. PsM8]
MSQKVQVTLDREDWEHIVRLVQRVAPAASQSVDDAYERDEDEGPDVEWIEARERSAAEARALSGRVTAAVQGGVPTQ